MIRLLIEDIRNFRVSHPMSRCRLLPPVVANWESGRGARARAFRPGACRDFPLSLRRILIFLSGATSGLDCRQVLAEIAAMEISVLKNGETLGPFHEQDVIDKVESGELSEDDLAMAEGLEEWTPLRMIIVREAAGGTLRAEVDYWAGLAAALPEQVKAAAMARPLGTGIVALIIGCVLIVFSRWPVLIFGPFVVAAMGAGVFLMARQRMLAGIVLMTAAIIVPATLCVALLYRR